MNATRLLICLLAMEISMQAANRPVGKSFATRSEVIARHGVAATSQPLATQTALDILKQGGSAVDAAIAANAVLGLVEPVSNGVGGDLFAMVWDPKSQRLHGLNASGRSPYTLTLDHFRQQGLKHIPRIGPLPVTVPGCVDGWFELHGKFGKLPMKSVLSAAIGYAEEGFPVSEVIAEDWEHNARVLKDFPNFKETYMPGGQTPRKGQIFRNPNLAGTLRKIATEGREVFYRGEIARAIAAFMKGQGGFLSGKDLADHKSEWVEPVSTNYRGYDVWELTPNTQGIAALQMLNILEGYDLRSMGFGSAEYLHLFLEAKKLVFEDRAKFYADPDFFKVPLAELISKPYAAQRRKLIDPQRAALRFEPGDLMKKGSDTIYLTVADDAGMMVSLIQSNYRGMGSGMSPDGLGFILHDRGELFNLEEGHANSYAPHKRPFHTIIPAFISRDGKPWVSFGVMGGDMQPQGHVQIVVNLIDFSMNLQEAGDAPRAQHMGSSAPTGETMTDGGIAYLEHGFSEETERRLLQLGHKVARTSTGTFGGYQAIMVDSNRVYYGASESRKDGQAAGF